MIDSETLASIRMVIFDFDGVFTDNTVSVSQDGVESVQCWRSDGLGLARLKEIGVKTFIISTEANRVVTVRAAKLKVDCKQNIEDKSVAILETCREVSILAKDTMFVGNDINDIPGFETVGFPVAVNDAYPEVDEHVLFRTQKSGGRGAVREVCDLIYFAKNRQSGVANL